MLKQGKMVFLDEKEEEEGKRKSEDWPVMSDVTEILWSEAGNSALIYQLDGLPWFQWEHILIDFPGGSDCKDSECNTGNPV